MSAAYQKELDFMTALLTRLRLPVHLLHPGDPLTFVDDGLRALFGIVLDEEAIIHTALQWNHERTIYKVLDPFMCHYVYFHLPVATIPTAVVIGPYLTVDPTREALLEQLERLGLPLQRMKEQTDYYASLPVFHDPSTIMAIVTTFGEKLWGDEEGFDMVDVNYEQAHAIPHTASADTPIEQTDILQQMTQMEARYAYENELMEIVSRGLTHRAEVMMSSVSELNYQQRLADPLRNIKNYCIICNTLLRKAAQKGGVHPLYLDRQSEQFARSIENAPTLSAGQALIGEMIRAYCRLVRTHSGHQYSAVVQKTIAYIEANLSGDLSLGTLARLMQLTPGYLSSLFHRETGQTLTSYIGSHRMQAALQLLQSTRLQVQSIAQLCGFSDPNYFARLFKRHFGLTPGDYRREQNAIVAPNS